MARAVHWEEERDPEPPRRFELWGLGKLLGYYRPRLADELADGLERLNVRRRTLYHYGHSDGESGLREATRTYVQLKGEAALYDTYKRRHGNYPDQGRLLTFATDELLREHALEAIETALATRAWAIGQQEL